MNNAPLSDEELDELISALRFNGRYATETEAQAAQRRVRERERAAIALSTARQRPVDREAIARIIDPDAFGSDFGLPDAVISKHQALSKADAILELIGGLGANGGASSAERAVSPRSDTEGAG